VPTHGTRPVKKRHVRCVFSPQRRFRLLFLARWAWDAPFIKHSQRAKCTANSDDCFSFCIDVSLPIQAWWLSTFFDLSIWFQPSTNKNHLDIHGYGTNNHDKKNGMGGLREAVQLRNLRPRNQMFALFLFEDGCGRRGYPALPRRKKTGVATYLG